MVLRFGATPTCETYPVPLHFPLITDLLFYHPTLRVSAILCFMKKNLRSWWSSMLTRKEGLTREHKSHFKTSSVVCVWKWSGCLLVTMRKIPFRILWDESHQIYWFIQLIWHHFTIYFRCDSGKYFMIPLNFQKLFVTIVTCVFMTLAVLNMYQRNIRNDLIIHSKAR